MAVTAQKFRGLFECFYFTKIDLIMLDVNKYREWVVDRSQNMGPNYGNIFGHLGQSVNAQKLMWAVLWEFMH